MHEMKYDNDCGKNTKGRKSAMDQITAHVTPNTKNKRNEVMKKNKTYRFITMGEIENNKQTFAD